ncbi:MAG TPA: NAD(P)-dependent oxidoreductase [Polyangia bacterium]|jgi:3-hydroxyisobutyrate dehydrogenase
MRVGFIGLGIMGGGMAGNLLAKGHALTVWNRTAERAAKLRAAGAAWADSPRALAAASEVVCTCVADPAALLGVSEGRDGFLAGLSPGTLVIDFSTVGPAAVRQLDEACRARDARFLAAPVTGSKNAAAAGTLLLMCGGSPETFAAAQPILGAVGAKAILVGDVVQAAQMKLVGNLMIAHMVEALSEGTALAAGAGIGIEKVLEVVQASGYASPFWDFKGKALAARDFSTHFSIDLMHKDLTLALGLGDKQGVPLPGTSAIREVFQLARAQGKGDRDIMATATVISPSLDEKS